MRALRVVGVTGDGSVVLEDPGRRERYTVPADEQLRAAARGDVTRLGQIAIELESQLRPREIQARIRGGASVDEVAAAAGVPTQKIERFAYPVLLERSRTAELAQGAHPQRADGPDSRTLGETVAHTFGLRSQDYTTAGWDSWKGDDGKWVVALTWQTGRSDNAAHWAFQPGAHGGTVVPLDEHASDLIEGLPARPLRPIGAVVDMARDDEQAPAPSEPAAAAPARAVAGGAAPGPGESWAGRGAAPEQRRSSPPPRPRVEAPARGPASRADVTRAPATDAPVIPRVETPAAEPDDAAVPDAPASIRDANGTGPDSGSSDSDSTANTGSTANAGSAASTGSMATAGSATGDSSATSTVSATGGGSAASTAPDIGSAPEDDAAPDDDSAPDDAAVLDTTPEQRAPSEAEGTGTDIHTAAHTGSTVSASSTDHTAQDSPAATDDATTPPAPENEPGTGEDDPPAPSSPDEPPKEDGDGARQRGSAASRRSKKGKPVMPSWDEVLLGVRGQR